MPIWNIWNRAAAASQLMAAKKRKRVATIAQRRAANIRERRRMFNLNEAFDKLRRKVPTFAYEKRLSRIETLRLAITYISFMDQVIHVDPKVKTKANVTPFAAVDSADHFTESWWTRATSQVLQFLSSLNQMNVTCKLLSKPLHRSVWVSLNIFRKCEMMANRHKIRKMWHELLASLVHRVWIEHPYQSYQLLAFNWCRNTKQVLVDLTQLKKICS